jgi:hypothetical protein
MKRIIRMRNMSDNQAGIKCFWRDGKENQRYGAYKGDTYSSYREGPFV